MDKIYFLRNEKGKPVLQSLQWKSFTNATDTPEVLQKVLKGNYIAVTALLPKYMVESQED